MIDMLMRQQGRRRSVRTRLRSWLPRRHRVLLPLCLAGDSAGKGVSVENAAVGITTPGVSSDAQNEAVISALSPLWRWLAAVAVLISPLVLLDLTAEMAAVSWWAAPAR